MIYTIKFSIQLKMLDIHLSVWVILAHSCSTLYEFRSLICICPLFTQGAGTKGQLQKHLAMPKGSKRNMLSVGAACVCVWSCRAEVWMCCMPAHHGLLP